MARVVGDIAVSVGADVSGLQAGMDRAGRSVKDFESRAARMGATFGKVAVAVAAAGVAITAAGVSMARSAGDVGREIKNLSDVSGTGVVEFQRYALAARSVGIEQEKLADILKDVNDKFGDFMATGAGPLADFFENIAPAVGVTAEQFARLSGPEALQLYVTSLERAGLSQQQMTFYMEALASDATALLPLLRDNGMELRRLGDEAQRSGRILSGETVAGAVELDQTLRGLSDGIRGELISAMIGLEDELVILADFFVNTIIPAIEATIKVAAAAAKAFADLAKLMALVRDPGATVGGDVADSIGDSLGGIGGDGSGPMSAEDANELYGLNLPVSGPLQVDVPVGGGASPAKRSGSRRAGGGGGGGLRGPSREDFEALQQRYMAEAELVEQQREDALEKLREYREAKLATEEEYNELEAQITKEHQDRLTELEQQAQQARMQAVSGALGDLASLMLAENEKLFKIGQAAAIADAVVNGYSAAVSAWEKGMKVGGPPVAAAFTAASLARTGALISGIASQSSRGTAGAAATGPGAGANGATAAQPAPRRLAEFRVEGNNVRGLGALIDDINQAIDDGYQINIQYGGGR